MSKHLRLGKLLWMFGFVLTFLAVSGSVGYAQLTSFSLSGSSPTVTMGVIDNATHTVSLTVPVGTLPALTVRPTNFTFGGLAPQQIARLFWTGTQYAGPAVGLEMNWDSWFTFPGSVFRGLGGDMSWLNYQTNDASPAPGYQAWVAVEVTTYSNYDWNYRNWMGIYTHRTILYGTDTYVNYLVTITESPFVMEGSNQAEIITYAIPGTTPVVTPVVATTTEGVDQVTNTVTLYVPYGELCTMGAAMATNFTVSPGAELYLTYTPWLGSFTDLRSHSELLMTSGTSLVNYLCANDKLPADGTQIWLTVMAESGYMENYTISIVGSPASPEKFLTGLDGNTDASSIITGLTDCLGTERPTVVSPGVANGLGGFDYTLTLLTGIDNDPLTFTYEIAPLSTVLPASPAVHTFTSGNSGVAYAFSIVVTAQDLTTATYRFIPNWIAPSTTKSLDAFSLMVPKFGGGFYEAVGSLNNAIKTYTVHVPYGTHLSSPATMLAAKFTLSDQYAILTHSEDIGTRQVSEVTTNNYSEPVAFTVFDQGCGTLEYFVVVIEDANAGNDIISIGFSGTGDDFCYEETPGYTPWTFTGNFNLGSDPGDKTVDGFWTLTVPYGTNLSTFTTTPVLSSGATMDPATITGYTVPFHVTVTAANGVSRKHFLLNILVAEPSDAHLLTSFNFLAANNPGLGADVTGTVNEGTHRVDVVVPWATDLSALTASFTMSTHACVFINGPGLTDHSLQVSGVTVNDFTNPLTYTVVSQAGAPDEGYYNVVVTKTPADTHNELTGLAITGQTDCLTSSLTSEITGASPAYVVRLRNVRDAGKELSVSFTIPALATASHTSPVTWTPVGNTPLTITVTSQSGDAVDYTITPNWVVPSTLKQITAFSFEPYVTPAGTGNMQLHMTHGGAINEAAKTITVHVPYGTDVTALKATFTLNDKYARLTHSEENLDLRVPQTSGLSPINYTTPAAFTVYDEACNTVEYFVTVIVDPNAGNLISSLTFAGKEYQNCASCEAFTPAGGTVSLTGNAFTVTVPYGTAMTGFELSGVISEGATVSPALSTITSASFGTPITLTVTAADGVATNVYTVTFVRGAALTGTQLITFGFEDHNNGLTADVWTLTPINHNTLRIDIELPYGVSLTNLVSSFTHSPMACVFINGPGTTDKTLKCSGTAPGNDYTHAVTYTVVAQNGNEAYYNVYVKNTPPATDKWLNSFVVTGLPRCFSNLTYGLSETASALGVVTRTGNAINISVKAGTDLTNLTVGFAIPTTATVSPNPATTHNFSSPVAFTVTAQDGSTAVYTVTVTPRASNGEKKILTYTFPTATSSTIDETAKKVDVWVPWATNLHGLVATFTLSSGAEMTHSEDIQVLQTSGSSANDFTTPVAYTVWAENCTSVEYFVTVHITPNTNTGISQFTFTTTGCGCDLGVKIDDYARRIYIRIPNRDANGVLISLTSLAPSVIGIANGATISPAVTVAQNWTNGPVKYTVTAPDGVTKADWMVSVVNPPCTATDILTYKFVDGINSTTQASFQVGNAVIDAATHTVIVTVKPNTDLKTIYTYSTLSCGASICCTAGNCAGTALDFSTEGNCRTCVVKAQDATVTQDWTICVKFQDLTIPVVTTWSVMAYNCLDSVAVQSNEAGRVFLVNESKVVNNVPVYNLADWTGSTSVATSVAKMVADRMGAYATIANANDTVYVKTSGLYSGIYYAYSVDNSGNISCISAQRVYLDICDVEVATMCDLRGQPMVYRYTLTGEVFVTYEETRTGGNLKYVQDATCGIKIVDKLNGMKVSYGVGQGLKNLRGTLDNSGVDLTFIPDCCYAPTLTTTGNVVAPIELSWDQFKADCYGSGSAKMYESMLVKITTPMIAFDDYDAIHPNWMFNVGHASDLATTNAMGGYEYFIQSEFNSSLIGTPIPTVPAYYTGIRTNVNWGSVYGLITPRKAADIVVLTAPVITGNPNPALIGGVVVGLCGTVNIKIYNEGVGNATITALYLDDAAATDGFNLLTPPAVPFTLGTWTSNSVTVNFCPTVAGNKTTYLVVEYGVGQVLRIPINGTTMLIYPLPFSENFNASTPPAAWNSKNLIFGNYGNGLTADNGYLYGWSWVTPKSAKPIYLITPGIDMRGASHPILTFRYGTVYDSYFRVDISTDYTNWTTLKDWGWHTLGVAKSATYTVDLSSFAGQIVYVRFYSAQGNYFGVDDVLIQEQVTTPIPSVTPLIADFGGVQVGQTGTIHVTLINKGVSILKVKGTAIVAPSVFGLTDTNTYPVEVTNNGYYAYSINGKESVEFDVTFSPTDIGAKTGKIVITYGLYNEQTIEIPMKGEGLSCYTAAEATIGQNYAPSQNTWFKYTADKFSIVEVTSCDAHQDLVTDEYAWDTFLYLYSDCEGTLIGSNDDMEGACVYNRASSSVTTTVNAGETIYIFWPLSFPTAQHAYEGFYFNINVSYPVDGDVCENAIPLTLPVVNHFGTTRGFNDDYDVSPCSPFSNYMDGNDKVYTISLPYEGYLTANILGAYGSVHVLDICPTETLEKFHCKLFIGGPNGGQNEKKIAAGTYFVIISTWSPPQTVDYLLNMSFRGTGVDNSELMSNLNVYPNPTNGKFTVSISNTEALDMTLELVNISGQVVYRNEVKAAYSYNEDIDATTFAKGVYYLKVNNGKGVKIEKVVIQ